MAGRNPPSGHRKAAAGRTARAAAPSTEGQTADDRARQAGHDPGKGGGGAEAPGGAVPGASVPRQVGAVPRPGRQPGARPAADGDTGPTRHAIEPGLHLVATPIGAARDITLRALDVLAGAEVLAAEDTRRLRQLLRLHGIDPAGRQIIAYHDHNGARVRPRLVAALEAGRSVAYASDAGTPLVADPGYRLVRAAIDAGVRVMTAPGPSAALAALAVAGLPSDRFLFAGFVPAQAAARQRFLREVTAVPATLVMFETPHRINRTFADLLQICEPEREVALCRELTKRFEEVRRGPLGRIAQECVARPPRGEIVLVLDRARPIEGAWTAGVAQAAAARPAGEMDGPGIEGNGIEGNGIEGYGIEGPGAGAAVPPGVADVPAEGVGGGGGSGSAPPAAAPGADAAMQALRAALRDAMARVPLSQAVAQVAARTGVPRRQVYKVALALREGNS